MHYYRFKTFTTSYYFPETGRDKKFLYGLYSPYGGKLSKLYWYLFTHYSFVRKLSAVNESQLDFPYSLIKKAEKNNSLMSFNMGSPGPEQKISILGYDDLLQRPFFAKFSQKPAARALSKNEIEVLTELKGTGLVPELLHSEITEDYVFLKTECISGERPGSVKMSAAVLSVVFALNQVSGSRKNVNDELKCGFSHGDFCPWNMLIAKEGIRMVDWEMAGIRTLGYDLFTYIFQPAFLLMPGKRAGAILKENSEWIERYFDHFGIGDWREYLKNFIDEKVRSTQQGKDQKLMRRYEDLKESITND